MYFRKAAQMILLNFSVCPFFWGWYVAVNKFFIPRI